MKKISISEKLILAFLFISLVTIYIVGAYSFYYAKDAILERTFNQLTSVRVVKTNLVEKFLNDCVNDAKLLTSSSDIKSIINDLNLVSNDSNLVISNSAFLSEISKVQYEKISIIGKNKLVYNVKDSNKFPSKQDYSLLWDKAFSTKEPFLKDFSKLDSLSTPVITICSGVYNNNEAIGMIVLEVSLKSINVIMLENNPSNGLGESGESYLVGHDFLMRSSSRFQSNSVLETVVRTQAVDSAFNNIPGTKIIEDYRGVSVLSSYDKINNPYLNWAIMVEIDFEEVTIPIYRIRNEIAFISIFIFFIVLVVVVILSRKITSPIKKLNNAAHEISEGNFDIEIKNNLTDEIGELTDTFNQMTNKLKEQTEELKAEKTKSLRSLIDGQETERQRLSRELHDSLGQLLIGLKLKYESCLSQSNIENESFEKFNELGLLFDKTIEETRRISNNLMPAALSEFGLSTAIRNICNEIAETTNINVDLKIEGSNSNLNQNVKTYIFRIIQEALTNILKHSKAKNAIIDIVFKKKIIILRIEDDGQGFDKQKVKSTNSNGLNNMKDRIALLSGKLSIFSELTKGTKLNIEIPIEEENNE